MTIKHNKATACALGGMILILVLAGLLLCTQSSTMQDIKGETEIIEIAGHKFQQRVLANGLKALAVRDGGKGISIFMVVAAGKRQETDETTGLAHLTEHVMYTGTALTGPGEHEKYITNLGGQSNAFTREDYTLFYNHQLPVKSLRTVLQMEADRLRKLNFPEDAFAFEQQQLRKEEAATWQVSQIIDEQLEHQVYTQHPYRAGLRDSQGHTRGPTLTLEQVKAFYDQWYRPRHVAVLVVGNIATTNSLDAIEAAFGSLQNGNDAQPVPLEPWFKQRPDISLQSNLSRDRLEWVWLLPAMAHGDRPALTVLAEFLSRRRTASGKPLSVKMGHRVDRDLLRIAVTDTRDGEEIGPVIQSLLAAGFDRQELTRIKKRLAQRYQQKELRARPYFSLAADVATHAALGQLSVLRDYEQQILSVGQKDLQRVAEQYLNKERRVTVLFKRSDELQKPLPQNINELHRVAVEAEQSGDLQRSILAYSELLKLNPNRMNKVIFLASRGQVQVQARNYDEAIADFESALQIIEYPDVREMLEETRSLKAGITTPGSTEQKRSSTATDSTSEKARSEDKLKQELKQKRAQLEQWRKLKFLSNVEPEYIEAQNNLIAGWYESDNRRLVVVKGRSREFTSATLLHELHHALQDQHWNLTSLHRQATDKDQQRTLQALIEGEAMLAVAEIMGYDFEKHMSLPEKGPVSRARFEKLFNYGQGLRFVRSIRDRGGWDAVNKIWQQPPQHSSEIYHPERYDEGTQPALNLPQVNGKVIKTSRWGEFEFRWLLTNTESTRPMTEQLGAKLQNDLWQLVEASKNERLEYWTLLFNDETSARQFIHKGDDAIRASGWQAQRAGKQVHLQRDYQAPQE